jgi:hypothetical protein
MPEAILSDRLMISTPGGVSVPVALAPSRGKYPLDHCVQNTSFNFKLKGCTKNFQKQAKT